MDAANARRQLSQWVALITTLYDEFAALYLGWYEQSMVAGTNAGQVHDFERRMARHLENNRSKIKDTVTAAVRDAAVVASALAGDEFRSKTTQSARNDLEAISVDDMSGKIVAQLQRDQATLAHRRTRARLQSLSEQGVETGLQLSPDIEGLLYRPDSLGRRRKARDYIQVEINAGLFGLTNTLTYALLLQSGQTVCTLDHALEGSDWIALDNFLKVQSERMHPRSTLLIHRILES